METSARQALQYRHLIYLKEMEALYYRSKCEQFLTNVDVIVNAKMSHKGNHIIYELDVTNRELRSLKDHYYLMEKYMRDEIKNEFQTAIHQRDNFIKKLKENNAEFQDRLATDLHMKVEEVYGDRAIKGIEAMLAEEQEKKESKEGKMRQNSKRMGKKSEEVDREEVIEHLGSIENYKTIIKLEGQIRQMKQEQMIKDVVSEEKHEKEMAELKQKLTMNSSLWE